MEAIIADAEFSLATINTVIDMNDFENTIQYLIDDRLFWEFIPGLRKKNEVFIRKSEVSLEDAYIQLNMPQEQSFYKVSETLERLVSESSSGDMLSIYMRLDKTSELFERKVLSLAEVLGEIGGFHSVLIGVGSFFISIFSERLFTTSVLRKIYHIDTWQEKEMLESNPKKNVKRK